MPEICNKSEVYLLVVDGMFLVCLFYKIISLGVLS